MQDSVFRLCKKIAHGEFVAEQDFVQLNENVDQVREFAEMNDQQRHIGGYTLLSEMGASELDAQEIFGLIDPSNNLARYKDFLIEANQTDAGNAECFNHLYGDDFRYCTTRKKWLKWQENYWGIDNDNSSRRAMLQTIRARCDASRDIQDVDMHKRLATFAKKSENLPNINNALLSAQALQSYVTHINVFDSNPMLAIAGNTTLDLQKVLARPIDRNDYITHTLGTCYDPEAICPRFEQFMNEIFANNAELVSFLQRAIGYTLTGNTREQCLFLCVGNGANGKSILLNTIGSLLGDFAKSASFDTFDADKRNTVGNDLAVLKGKRFVPVIEADEDRRLSEARVKSVTGNDQITCRFLYGEPFNYRPQFKLWIAMNHKPTIKGTDNGIWRRIHLIKFEQSFIDKPDKELELKLKAELPGILNWALAGVSKWQEQGLNPPQCVIDATSEYRDEMDIVGQWLKERTVTGLQAVMRAKQAFDDYYSWCTERHEFAKTITGFGRALAEHGLIKDKDRNGTFYKDIGLQSIR